MKSNPLIKLRKGAWAPEEDNLLRKCIEKYGEGKWHLVPQRAGLNRCRKSCRLRWLNYLRPIIKRGDFAEDEVDLIIRLHKLLGNRWSLIAGRLPGRTANDVKNYWNTNLQKKSSDVTSFHKSEELIKQKGENRNITTTTSTVVIKPLPRTLSKGTTVPCFSYHSSSVDNSSSAEENTTHNTNMVIDDDDNNKPQSPTARVPDQDGIEWWKKVMDEIGIGDGEEEEEEWSRDRDLLMMSSSTKSTGGVVEADGQNGWSDIWDILDADCHFN